MLIIFNISLPRINNYNMDFNKIIKDKGLLKTHVAKKIGISNVRLSQYLNGHRSMPEEVKNKLTWYLMEV